MRVRNQRNKFTRLAPGACGRGGARPPYVKNTAYMAGQTPFFGDFPATWPNFGAEALAVAEAPPRTYFFCLTYTSDK